ncbi:putative membrane protein [Methanosarcina horonobensis HB-1 = JCM 15518]|uniref:Putative membrane protein n=1 Tax=Methanosarcina horonobensis HB-1 = JCM 15518 TaxID=1434110 RepID=A0A0E3S824_9EURY|nr:HdeD family acid-resistance protein [Methanosarcina horonobensis]AKB77594.1 putative membrane protein [Methanosarcina horonobensis HB-1 = JCM 15518]
MEQTAAEHVVVEYEILQVPWWLIVLEGIFAVIIGLFLLFSPVKTTITLVQILGIFWLLGGALSILSLLVDRENLGWKLLSGIMGILIGLLVFVYPLSPFVVLAFFVIILGIWSIVYGAIRVVWALKGGGLGMAVLGLLTIILGILLLINPLAGAVVLPWIYGISLVIGGIAALVGGLRMRSGRSVS